MNSTAKHPPEARRIMDSIRRLVRALRVYSRESEGKVGLSAAQLFVLQELGDGARLSLKELAARTMTDASSVSVVVERLAKKGLLQRQRAAEDSRRLELWISAKGRLTLRGQPDALQVRLIAATSKLAPAQRRALAVGLEKLLKNAGLADEEAALFLEPEAS